MGMTEDELKTWVSTEVKSATTAAHLVHLPMYLILIAVLVFGGFMMSRTLTNYEVALTKAQDTYTQLQKQEAQDRKDWEANEAKRDAAARQVQIIEHTITVRDQVASTAIKQVKAPDHTNLNVLDDAKRFMNVAGVEESDGKLGFDKRDVQDFIGYKLDDDRLTLDNADQAKQIDLKDQSLKSSVADNASCQKDLVLANTTIDTYKKAAVKSKWAKIGDALVKVGAFAGGVALGHLF